MKKLLSVCLALYLLSYCVSAGALVGGQGYGSGNMMPTPQPSITQRDLSFPSTEPESVTVTYDKTEYTVSLISVGLDEDGKRTVNVFGLGTTLPVRNGKRIAHIRAGIKANGFTYEWNELLINGLGVATFLFGTNAYPEKLLLYSYDNGKRKTLTLNAEDVAAAAAAEYKKSQVHILDDYQYTVDEDGKATITGYPSTDATVTIPSSLDGYSVIGIEFDVFMGHMFLETVKLPSGMQTIGDGAFSGCSALESINLPARLKTIGGSAFSHCSSLESIYIPENVEYVGPLAFESCKSLKSIKISSDNRAYYAKSGVLFHRKDKELTAYPNGKAAEEYSVPEGIVSIGGGAFAECKALLPVSLPEGLQSIGDKAFYNCQWLRSVNLPEGLQSIGGYAFYGCASLASVSLPDSLQSIGSGTFEKCSSLTAVELPDKLQSIDYRAFAGCTLLTSVSLPASVKSISESAFENCPALILIVPQGSYAQEYAEANGTAYQIAE